MSNFGNFTDKYMEVYDPASRALELRYKTQAEGSLNILQTMELIDTLLRRYQTVYKISKSDKNLILFPFMFIQPEPGDKILNTATNEEYTVDQVILNPSTNEWQGLVRLSLINAPDPLKDENLVLLNEVRYVSFDHSYNPSSPNNINANSSGGEVISAPMKPQITWALVQKEPASTSGRPFEGTREYKPRLRDQCKDPVIDGYTVSIYGQWFDSIVQFDVWYANNRAAEHLIDWFEQFMSNNTWILRRAGLAQILFWKRTTDDLKQQWRQPVWNRSVQYFLRTEQLHAVYERDLLKLSVSLDVTTGNILPALRNKRYIADQLVSGTLTASGYRRLFYDESGNFMFGAFDILQ